VKTPFIVLLAALTGGVCGWIGAHTVYRDALDRISLLTPVVVLDATDVLKGLDVHSTPEEIAAAMEKVKLQAEKLKQAGFIVMKPNAVMAAPEAVHVKVEN